MRSASLRALGTAAAALALGASLAPGPARALDGNDELELRLSSGEELSGWFYGLQDGELVITGSNRFTRVPVTMVDQVRRAGAPMALADFHAEAARIQLELSRSRAAPPPHPHPRTVTALSFAWAGAGHAALGDWRGGLGYMSVDAVLWGGAAWSVLGAEQLAPVIPLAALDLLVRGVAAGQAARRARARRDRLRVGGPAVPGGS